ncbi:potassium channel family protein [Thermodesulfobacteriota bacterium]
MQKRLYIIMAAILLVVLLGSTGYYIIYGGEPRFLDCVYMTVISLTTVGYGEVLEVTGNAPAQIFSMILITFGMGIILYGISTLTAMIVEGEVSGILRRKRMEKKIEKLTDHYIICGGGETGRHVLHELITNKEQVVLIELENQRIEACKELGNILYIEGDAMEDANLLAAGIKKAVGIVIGLPHDRDTVYVTMTARMLNSKIRIISRMTDPKTEPKLRKAGADAVVSPNFIGGLRMASELIRPAAVSFLDKMLRSSGGNLRIHELTVTNGSNIDGKTLKGSGLREKFDILVLASRDPGQTDIQFNPPVSKTLTEGTTLMVMGDVENIAKARAIA